MTPGPKDKILVVGNGQRRNEPCHCGSGRKWKKCCGAPVNGERITLAAVPPQKGM